MSWWTPDRQAYAVSALVNGGLSPYGAAGLVSRWANVESAVNGPTSQGGYKGRAWGIAQWLGSRLPAIDQNPSFDDQLAYVLQELQRPESSASGRAYQLLQSAADADAAAVGASLYERAGGYNASTGRDNYTSRTAAGVLAVLNNWQGVQAVNSSPDQAYSTLLNLNPLTNQTTAAVAGGIGAGTVLLIGGGLLLAWLLID